MMTGNLDLAGVAYIRVILTLVEKMTKELEDKRNHWGASPPIYIMRMWHEEFRAALLAILTRFTDELDHLESLFVIRET